MAENFRILLIEDDKVDQMAFERFVERENLPYDYQIAGSVSEARAVLAAERFDAALIDYFLGDGTAFDLFGEVRETPVVMITGSGDEDIAVQAMKAGAYDYLVKDPAGNYLTTLPITVENAIRRKRAEEELRQYQERLEELVKERTAELTQANEQLLAEIAERVRAEEERALLVVQIREQAQQVRQIISTVPEGVLLLDADLRVLLANPAAKGDLAVLADASVGDTLTHLGDRPLAELLTSPPKGLWHEVATDGRSFEVIARPMESGPEPEGWVFVIRDVTQEREIQQRLQHQERLAAVGQLAAGIAHDFNNIMAVIVLYTGMGLRIPDLPPKLHKHLETVSQQAIRATVLIQQILDFSRRAVLERRPMDLVPFLKEQVKLLERTLPESIKIDLAYGVDEYTVNADPTRMQQVIMNLAVNARDAMPEGGELCIGLGRIQIKHKKEAPLPEMALRLAQDAEAGEWVRVTVRDTGTGIPPDAQSHLFEPFFTTKEVGKGTGLGLAQVHGIVKQHEGEIDVITEMGKGTTFVLYLPALPVAEPEALPEERLALPRGQGETILVVEDNTTTREALVDSLELLNYRVLEAANGREALEILESPPLSPPLGGRKGGIALVLSDLVMPVMGGQALFHTLRQQDSAVKMVMLTGHPMARELEELRAQGLDGWLLKPLNIEQLAEVVARALEEVTDEQMTNDEWPNDQHRAIG